MNKQKEIIALYEQHRQYVYRLALKCVHIPELAEDITQDAFLKAWRGIDSFDGSASIKTWLLTIAMNTIRDVMRHKALVAWTSLEQALEEHTLPILESESPECEVIGQDNIEHLISSLSPRHRQMMRMIAEGHEYSDIAGQLGVSSSAVKTAVMRFRRKMQAVAS